MAVTIAQIINLLDNNIGDTSNDRVTLQQRYDAITEAVIWTQEEMGTQLHDFTYEVPFYDTINRYNISTILSDLLMSSDLRKMFGENSIPFTFKSGSEVEQEISNSIETESYSIERYDEKAYLIINHKSKNPKVTVSNFDTLTDGGGTWLADTTTSGAKNLSIDSNNYLFGTGSLSFDIDVAQSVQMRASVYNLGLSSIDVSSVALNGSAICEVYLQNATNIVSMTLSWGDNTSNYYTSTTVTTIDGTPFKTGNNTIKFDWTGSTTKIGSPTNFIKYVRIDINYGISQTNISGNRIDFLRFVKPETLRLFYSSWNVGKTASNTPIQLFSSQTDKPYFSGQYDQLKIAVAHYAANIVFKFLRLYNEAQVQEVEAIKAQRRVQKLIPSSRKKETKSFKVTGINFRRR